jgi:hypothetical protein
VKKQQQSAPVVGVSQPTDNLNRPTSTVPPGMAETSTTPNPASQLAKAEALLEKCGYERQPDGSYFQTPDAQRLEIYSLDLASYQFRDLIRAGNAYARERLDDEITDALSECVDKFGLDGGSFAGEIEEQVCELLMDWIENEAESDAELKKEEEELEEEEDLSLVRGSGSVAPTGGGAE